MKVLITGATGFLGGALAQRYLERGHELWCWQHRKPLPASLDGRVQVVRRPEELAGHFDLVVNLAGASLVGGPWTRGRRDTLRASRIDFTRALLARLGQNDFAIDHLISGSAIGYYGNNRQPVGEDGPAGQGFSAGMIVDWEKAAEAASEQVECITRIRTGLVLSREGGLLPVLARPARFGLATRLGGGQQGQSWIHLRDYLNALDWIVDQRLAGPVNMTAPNPVSQDAFNRTLAATLKRPYLLRMPGAPLRLALGELSALVLEGQYVLPRRLEESGFHFQFEHLETALAQLYGQD